jgi:hypothetical protein
MELEANELEEEKYDENEDKEGRGKRRKRT